MGNRLAGFLISEGSMSFWTLVLSANPLLYPNINSLPHCWLHYWTPSLIKKKTNIIKTITVAAVDRDSVHSTVTYCTSCSKLFQLFHCWKLLNNGPYSTVTEPVVSLQAPDSRLTLIQKWARAKRLTAPGLFPEILAKLQHSWWGARAQLLCHAHWYGTQCTTNTA